MTLRLLANKIHPTPTPITNRKDGEMEPGKISLQMTYDEARTIPIPDLWHLAEHLGLYTPEGAAVLETWHMAHDLKNALVEAVAKENGEG